MTFALQAVAHGAGYSIDFDDLNAALGASWMFCAVPGEDDPGNWPMYARDAFLVEAGLLFGMTIRPVHPPQAARGLALTPQFDQHFDASYRPLVHRALENHQSVLAWRGWPGDRRLMWGLIEAPCDDGVGFCGSIYTCPDEPEKGALERPPVQLYVVETVTPTQPSSNELWQLARTHGRLILNNELIDRFGVVTGPDAFDVWIDLLRTHKPSSEQQPGVSQPVACAPGSDLCRTSGQVDLARAHCALATSAAAAHRSAIRFLKRRSESTESKHRAVTESVIKQCQVLVTALEDSLDAHEVESMVSAAEGREQLAGKVEEARHAAAAMIRVLKT